ncbi:MAG: hypothetical protein J5I65_06325 [Aridibacter famidurans]|nr:hypothetical protein [Aridibacter famidurans]
MQNRRAPGVLLVAAAFAAALGYGIWLFNFGPYAAVRAAVPDRPLPEERFGYTGGDLYTFLDGYEKALDPGILESYANFQLFDTLNGVLLAVALALFIWALAARLFRSGIPTLLILLPLAMGAFDLLENFLIISVIRDLPMRYYGLAEGAGTATLLKMICGGLSFLSAVGMSVYAIYLRLARRKSDES